MDTNIWGGSRPNFLAQIPKEVFAVEIAKLLEDLKSLGVTKVEFGTEAEFGQFLTPTNPENKLWEEKRQQFVKELSDAGEAEKAERVKNFNAGEVMMHDIHQEAAKEGLLIPNFGTTTDGTGYYDAEGIFELRQKATEMLQSVGNSHIIRKLLEDKMKEYGFVGLSRDAPRYHYNFSFHDAEGNILEESHSKYETLGKKIIEGVTYSVAHAFAWQEQDFNNHLSIEVGANPSRSGYVRIVNGRIEIRPNFSIPFNKRVIPETSTEGNAVIALTGAIYGLNAQDKPDIHPAEIVLRPVANATQDSEKYKALVHFIEGSQVDASSKKLLPAAGYLSADISRQIAQALNLEHNYKTAEPPVRSLIGEHKYLISTEQIAQAFSSSEIVGDRLKVPDLERFGVPLEEGFLPDIRISSIQKAMVVEPYSVSYSKCEPIPLMYDRTLVVQENRAMHLTSPAFRQQVVEAAQSTTGVYNEIDTPNIRILPSSRNITPSELSMLNANRSFGEKFAGWVKEQCKALAVSLGIGQDRGGDKQ